MPVSLPYTVMSGIAGRRPGGRSFPRWTARLLGRLTVSEGGLSWSPLLPWRKPRLVTVAWSDIESIDTWSLTAAGWERLAFFPNRAKDFFQALERVGFVVHIAKNGTNRWQALRPGVMPDWP